MTENIVRPRVAYGILNSGKSWEHVLILYSEERSSMRCGFTIPVGQYDALVHSSLGGSNQRLRLTIRFELGHGINVAIKKTTLLKLSSGRENI